MVRILESVTHFTALGIRFWDPATERPVSDGLAVTACPVHRPVVMVEAQRTPSGVYAFSRLPGLLDLECGLPHPAPSSPPRLRDFLVQVDDPRGRYLRVAFTVSLPLPYRGAFPTAGSASPADGRPRGLHLYSSPGRPVPAAAAAIRGELLRVSDRAPAAHAVVRVETESAEYWYGLADERGRFVVILPYPALSHGFGGSPGTPGHRPLFEQSWPLRLSVLYQPEAQIVLWGTRVPQYVSVLRQAGADVFGQAPESGGLPLAEVPVELGFDRHPTVRTEGLSQLLVAPGTASP